jgi:hypothetical protein
MSAGSRSPLACRKHGPHAESRFYLDAEHVALYKDKLIACKNERAELFRAIERQRIQT